MKIWAGNEEINVLPFTKDDRNIETPKNGTSGSAGSDLRAYLPEGSITIRPDETALIRTGLHLHIDEGFFGAIFPRSGLAVKRGLRLANSVAVIDSDYRGEVKIALHNDSDVEQIINDKDRIAQLIIIPFEKIQFMEVEKLEETERGSGGFGSTGVM